MSAHPVRSRRALTVAVGSLLLVPLLTATASAHVAVSSADATRGGEVGLLAFRVPTESDTATTVKVSIELPADVLFADVSTEPMPGWSVSTTTRALATPTKVGDFTLTRATSAVTWTATPAAAIGPREFQVFHLLVGPLPDQPQLAFKAVQTYSDGSVVTWDEPTPASGTEPEHPAPVLSLPAPQAAGTTPAATTSVTDGSARVLGGLGLLVGAVGLLTAGFALRRTS